MYGIFDLVLWLARVFLALLKPWVPDLVAALLVAGLAGCTLVYVPANTRWVVQAGEHGTAASLERQKE